MANVLKTPELQFQNLKDYPFEPNFEEVNDLAIHYLDEGSSNDQTILLFHGEPSWSYLYRFMIPIFVKAGFRVIAPDLIGFGKSDKLKSRKDYSYQFHVNVMNKFVKKLDLKNITTFFQDWGGLIGLRIVPLEPERYDRIVIGNTGLPAASNWFQGIFGNLYFSYVLWRMGPVTEKQFNEKPGFLRWMAYSQSAPSLDIGKIIQGGTVKKLDGEEIRAYNAPFPDDTYKEGARIFPRLVPTQLRKNRQVWNNFYSKWTKPFLTLYSDRDPITKGQNKEFLEKIPGTKNQPHQTITNAGHFLQEDKGEEIANIMLKFIENT